ncbi:MAG: hypothetical protein EA403_14970 [Spirochaetaceae bacterium]|nr:MAG: hypothetical protein EA403_14970 [Spirochaetaceae bacterium]
MNRQPFRLVVALSVLLPILASCSPLFGSRESGSGGGTPGGGGPGGDNGGGVTYTLTVTVVGEGTVTINPDRAEYSSGDEIEITASPEQGHFLSHWSGDGRADGWLSEDLDLVIDGNTTITAVFSPDLWRQATAAAGWPAREGHAVVSYSGQLWILGGINGSLLNDVWSSSDGEEWAKVEPIGGEIWSGRMGHGAVVHDANEGDDEEIWVIGGAFLRDVWRSTNGAAWTRATDEAPWSARTEFLALAHSGKLWVMGGLDGEGNLLNDVWSSPNGATWTTESTGEIWSPRRGHVGVVFQNKLWVLGGIGAGDTLLNDVWSSSDGVTWTPATADAEWLVRSGHAAAVHDGKIWVFGGQSSGLRRYRDVWSSEDGETWTAEPHGSWSPRHKHRALSHNDRLWLIGGEQQWPAPGTTNDVWYLPHPLE